MGVEIMRHQLEGIEFLLERKSGLLAFEQGLGKTLVAIKAFAVLRQRGDAAAMLVICPNSLKRNWQSEVGRFEPSLSVRLIEGTSRARRRSLTVFNADVAITSYETARSEMSGVLALMSRQRTVLVLDESHNVKNRRALATIAAQQFAPRADYRWLLSGTPITNSVADLYSQIEIIAAGRPLGSFDSFIATYASANSVRREELGRRVSPYVLRRTKADCLDLPEKNVVDLRLDLPSWQRRLYDSMRDEFACEVEGMNGEQFRAFASTALAKLLRLSQIASNPGVLLPIEPRTPVKFEVLDDLVREIVDEAGEKVIIWSHYVATLEALLRRFARLNPVAIYGQVPAAERQAIAHRFQTDPECRVLIANPAAAGTGFNLTAARYAIYETLSWRFDFYAQSQDRIHRIGQLRSVSYVRLIAAETIEEVIVEALARKSSLAGALLGDPAAEASLASLGPLAFAQMLRENRLPIEVD